MNLIRVSIMFCGLQMNIKTNKYFSLFNYNLFVYQLGFRKKQNEPVVQLEGIDWESVNYQLKKLQCEEDEITGNQILYLFCTIFQRSKLLALVICIREIYSHLQVQMFLRPILLFNTISNLVLTYMTENHSNIFSDWMDMNMEDNASKYLTVVRIQSHQTKIYLMITIDHFCIPRQWIAV